MASRPRVDRLMFGNGLSLVGITVRHLTEKWTAERLPSGESFSRLMESKEIEDLTRGERWGSGGGECGRGAEWRGQEIGGLPSTKTGIFEHILGARDKAVDRTDTVPHLMELILCCWHREEGDRRNRNIC